MSYFHVVFTLPSAIGDIACQNKAVIYDLLFKASAETMLTIAADPKHPGVRIGPGRYTTMTLDASEFIRRFLIHVLPKGFHRIRHYGLFVGSNRGETIETVRKLLNLDSPAAEETAANASAKAQQTGETDPAQPLAHPCPCCGGRMFIIETFEPGRQPRHRPTAPLAIRIDTS